MCMVYLMNRRRSIKGNRMLKASTSGKVARGEEESIPGETPGADSFGFYCMEQDPIGAFCLVEKT